MKNEVLEQFNEILDSFEYPEKDKVEIKKVVDSVAEELYQFVQEEFIAVLPRLIERGTQGAPKRPSIRKTRKEEQKDEIGIDYHNLNADDRGEVENFLIKHSAWHFSTRDITLAEAKEIQDDQQSFRTIVSSISENIPLDQCFADHIDKRLRTYIYPMEPDSLNGLDRVITRKYEPGKIGHLMYRLYDWIVRLAEGEMKTGQCAVVECDNIFLIRKGGKTQKFCSTACRVKAHRDPSVLGPLEPEAEEDIPF